MSDVLRTFARWSSDRNFHLWRYTSSHSQVLLRSFDRDTVPDIIQIVFSSVERVELNQFYMGGIAIESVVSHGDYPGVRRGSPLLQLEITSPAGPGFVALAGGVRITRLSKAGEELELLHSSKTGPKQG
ncbi:hypothetical protein [Amycolatopsis sp. NPDC059657]|uniref:hypothetical protein n=1 Tax=Amycolatopsis sp. NPDC059657 TaxID=3346899 RepID=UPI00366F0AA3